MSMESREEYETVLALAKKAADAENDLRRSMERIMSKHGLNHIQLFQVLASYMQCDLASKVESAIAKKRANQ